MRNVSLATTRGARAVAARRHVRRAVRWSCARAAGLLLLLLLLLRATEAGARSSSTVVDSCRPCRALAAAALLGF
jgi:hypothetical protein